MDIDIHIQNERDCSEADRGMYLSLVEGICRQFGLSKGQISISIVGDDRISQINEKFLGHCGPTDVISFDLSEPGEAVFDIIVNAEMARRQGERLNHSSQAELALYITHGMLHNLGFDDADEDQSRKMHAREDEILSQAGFGRVYGL